MHVLLVSQYFPPEIGATQNRMQAFVDALRSEGHHVTVVCEQPNHPRGVFHPGFGRTPVRQEREERLTVYRLWVLASPRKTTLRRLMFYGTFAVGAFAAAAATPSYDIVLATSPPLPGAYAAAVAARGRRVPVVLDVRDLWPGAAEALGELSNRRLIKLFEAVERWLYRHSDAVTATTRPFCRHIDAVAGQQIAVYLPNGALDRLVALPHRPPPPGSFRIGYFGNFGIAQGLNIVVDAADALRDDPIEFLLVGGGPLEAELRARLADLSLPNVTIRSGVAAEHVGELLLSCHALLVPLRDHPLLSDFIPSKLYDAMAVGRPAIVAARGEAADFVRDLGFGVVVAPEDGRGLAKVARELAADAALVQRLGDAGKAASAAYARSAQAASLCELLESLARRPRAPRYPRTDRRR